MSVTMFRHDRAFAHSEAEALTSAIHALEGIIHAMTNTITMYQERLVEVS